MKILHILFLLALPMSVMAQQDTDTTRTKLIEIRRELILERDFLRLSQSKDTVEIKRVDSSIVKINRFLRVRPKHK